MPLKNRADLKVFFGKNAVPTADDFANLVDSTMNQQDDGIVKVQNEPLKLQGEGDAKTVLKLYKNFTDPKPWTLNLNPGFSIGDAAGVAKLFIDATTGNVGVGTADPGTYRLNVNGPLNVTGPALVTGNYLYVKSETAGRLRVGAAWGMPGLYSSDDSAQSLTLGVPSGQKVYLGFAKEDAFVEGGTGNAYFKGNVGIGAAAADTKLDVRGIMKVHVDQNTAKDAASKMSYGGSLVIKSNAPQLDFIDTDNNDWSIHVNGNKMYFIREPWNVDLVLDGNGNVGIGTDSPTTKLEVVGPVMEKLDVIDTNNDGNWGNKTHPIMKYFANKLAGKPVGTFVRAIQNQSGWRGHYWEGWVDYDGKIRVFHNWRNVENTAN